MKKLNFLSCLIVCGLTAVVCSVSAGLALEPKQDVLRTSLQMVLVTTPDWSTVDGHLQRYERTSAGGEWKPVGDPIAIVVGKKGMAWGAGVVPTDGAGIRDSADPVKKEGDGKSPAGLFRIGSAFGYAAQPPASWKMSYISLTPTVECVDDAASQFYNQVVDRATVTPDWNSSEHMANVGIAYRWGAVVNQNMNPIVPNGGSCVFIHVWGGPGMGTAGCTAMAQEQLEPILAWLDPAKNPLLVQLPVADYKKLRQAWHLPSLPH
jgi:hypothetical protein